MWICTQHGFYSIVRKPEGWHVRARVRKDLERVAEITGLEILKSYEGSDYPWRIIIDHKKTLNRLMRYLGDAIHYPNFKSQIASRPDQADKLREYSRFHDESVRWEKGEPAD